MTEDSEIKEGLLADLSKRREKLREMVSYSDGCVVSSKKDGLVNIGGFVGINNDKLHEIMQSYLLMWEGFLTYGDWRGETWRHWPWATGCLSW